MDASIERTKDTTNKRGKTNENKEADFHGRSRRECKQVTALIRVECSHRINHPETIDHCFGNRIALEEMKASPPAASCNGEEIERHNKEKACWTSILGVAVRFGLQKNMHPMWGLNPRPHG